MTCHRDGKIWVLCLEDEDMVYLIAVLCVELFVTHGFPSMVTVLMHFV